MKLLRATFPKSLGLAVLSAALLVAGTARADEYGDVSQLLRSGKHAEALTRADQYLAGNLKVDELVSRTYKLEEINDGFAALRSGQVARGVVVL